MAKHGNLQRGNKVKSEGHNEYCQPDFKTFLSA